jgi:hypothetical protein
MLSQCLSLSMPISPLDTQLVNSMHGYSINKDLGLLVIKYAGDTTIEQLGQLIHTITRDPDYSRELNILSDLRQLTSIYSYDQMQAVVDKFPDPGEMLGKTKSAILVSQDVTYGMARVWTSITDNRTVANAQVFKSLKEALEWLGLPREAEIEFPF